MKILLPGPEAVFIWLAMAGTLVITISAQSPAEGNLTDYSDPDDKESIFEGLSEGSDQSTALRGVCDCDRQTSRHI